jgi:methionine-rich copper-binding protein CopC
LAAAAHGRRDQRGRHHGVVFGLSTPASAHGQFVSSDPAKDAEVSMALASILLYFTEKPTSNAYFAVTTPSGVRVDRLWSHGSPRRLDTPVHEWYHNQNGEWETRAYTVAYPALVPIAYWPETGLYTVTYLSVATDGEPVRGEYTFTYSGRRRRSRPISGHRRRSPIRICSRPRPPTRRPRRRRHCRSTSRWPPSRPGPACGSS